MLQRLNLNVNIILKIWDLGLIKVHGTLPAELIEERLKLYGLNLRENIICIETDVAS